VRGSTEEYGFGMSAEVLGGRHEVRGDAAEPAKILVVEDEQIIALELKDRLTEMGHSVVGIVASGEEAIEHVRRLRPHLVLMDIKLQGRMDGIEASEAIRTEVDIPIVYLTAFADETTLQRAKLSSPYGYILKPFQERELHVIIEVSIYRHHLERHLRESEAWRFALLQGVGDGIAATSENGRVTFLNPLAEALTGWREQEAVGRPIEDVFRVVQQPERRSGIWKDVTYQKLIARDGSEHPIEMDCTTIRDPARASVGAVYAFRDISMRKRACDRQRFMAMASGEIAASLDRDMILSKVVTLMARDLADWCVIHVCGANGTLQLASFAHRETEKNEFANQLRDAIDENRDSLAIQNVARTGNSILDVDVADGNWIATSLGLDITLAPGLAAASAVIVPMITRGQTLGTLSLVSERRDRPFTEYDLAFIEEFGRRVASGIDNAQLYADAQRAIRLREDILATVSHDLRTPLQSIIMNADQLCRDTEKIAPTSSSPTCVMKNAQTIQRNAERMNRQIGDLLDIENIDRGRLSLDLQRHKAKRLLAEAVSMFEAAATARSINVVSTGPQDADAELLCDRERVLQVLSNLIGNALKFSHEGQSIIVQENVSGPVLVFSVSDKAGGLSPDQVGHVFERGWQAPEARHRDSGLGLYIAKGLVEAHGGRIWVDTTPGMGSTFHFTIPLSRPPETWAAFP
jgi:PAS domain S-box-containing protein